LEIAKTIEGMLENNVIMFVTVMDLSGFSGDLTDFGGNEDCPTEQFSKLGKINWVIKNDELIFSLKKEKIKIALSDDMTIKDVPCGIRFGFPTDDEAHKIFLANPAIKKAAAITYMSASSVEESIKKYQKEHHAD
jgi:hypothetical protein